MDGLQAIKDRILEEAREQADQILDQQKQRLMAEQAAADKEIGQIMAAAEHEAAELAQARLNRAHSVAAMETRKRALETRQEIIDHVIEKAVADLCQASDSRRTEWYIAMLRGIDDGNMTGEIVFSAADQAIAPAVVQPFAGRFQLAAEAGAFSGGFILRMGRIEDNLTYDLIKKNHRSVLVQTAAQVLFPSADSEGKEP